jgi:hypothetical protein
MLDDAQRAAILTANGQGPHMDDDLLQLTSHMGHAVGLVLPSMADARVRNAEAPWDDFSSEKYYDHNYKKVQAEDQEIIQRVSQFFTRAFAHRNRAECAIDVGSGSNLYPALLILPWTNRILLTDYSQRNVRWLRHEVREDRSAWAWQPFWQELEGCKGYDQIGEPRKQLREACRTDEFASAGIQRKSVFNLPSARWQLGTMFFVAESITEDFAEFRTAINHFVGALRPGAPFAATFMAESLGYEVDGTWFPALKVTTEHVSGCFEEFGADDLNVFMIETPPVVRAGYQGMIVATGIAGDRQGYK